MYCSVSLMKIERSQARPVPLDNPLNELLRSKPSDVMSLYSTSAKNIGSTHVAFGFLMGLVSFDLGLTTESSCLRGRVAARRRCLHSARMESQCERAGGSYRGLLGKYLPQPRLDLIKVTSPSVCLEESGTGGLAVVVGCNPFPIIGV
jgi:hypothetical protein